MNGRRIDVGETIRYGWATTKANLNLVVLLTLVAGLVSGVPSGIADGLKESAPGLALPFQLASFVLSMLVGIGTLRVSLRLHDGLPVTVGDLFRADWSLFWRYTLATIAYGLLIAVGFILLVVPGIILSIRYLLYGYLVLERGARPVAALAQSAAATQGARWDLFILGLALILLNIVGALLLLVGLLVTIPVSYLALARAYRTLTGGVPAPQPVA